MSSLFQLTYVRVSLALALLALSYPLGQLTLFAFTSANSNSTEIKFVQINKGQSPNDITKLLGSLGLIKDSKNFIWLGRLTRQWKHMKAGEYALSASIPPIEIFSILTSGISAAHPFTVREGENMYEIAEELETKGLGSQERFLSLCKDSQFIQATGHFSNDQIPVSLEGYLYPSTYFFNRTQTESDMIKQMVKHFFLSWRKKEEDRSQELHMTRHEIITLASIIEKETGAPEERALISSVFHNRLSKNMRLQSDPTTIYGMWDRYKGKIHKRDLSSKNEFNTYYVDALPVGPIGNPGQEAIQAALFPKSSNYYYFVSHNDGTHQFSSTIQEHNHAVRTFQLDPKAREGKSWRDHLKRPALVNSH